MRDKKIKIILNKNFNNGMASSIKEGIKHLSRKNRVFFYLLRDMPMINKQIYNNLIKIKKNHQIIIPAYKGQQR